MQDKNNSKIKRSHKIGFGLFGTLCLFVVTLLGIFSLPSIQTSLAHRFTNSLRDRTKAKVEVSKIQIDFLGQVSFNGVVGYDHQNDTLFYIDRFSAKLLEANQAWQGNLILDEAQLQGFDLRLRQYEGDSLTNLELFIQRLSQKKDKKARSNGFEVRNLQFREGNITLNVPGISKRFQSLQRVNFLLERFKVQGKQLSGSLKDVGFVSEGLGWVKNATATIDRSANGLSINDFYVQTARSQLTGKISVVLNPIAQTVDSLDFSLSANPLAPGEWGMARYYTKPLIGTVNGKGTLEDLQANDIEIRSDDFQFNGGVQLALNSLGDLQRVKVAVDSLTFSQNAMTSLIKDEKTMAALEKIPEGTSFFFKGNSSYEKKSGQLSGTLFTDKGSLHFNAKADFGQKGNLPFNIQFHSDQWNIKSIQPSLPLGRFSGKGTLLGTLSNKTLETFSWKIDVPSLEVYQENIKSIRTEGIVSQNLWKGFAEVNDPRLMAWTQFKLYPENPVAVNEIKLRFEQVDLSLLNSYEGLGSTQLQGNIFGRFSDLSLDRLKGNFNFSDIVLSHQGGKSTFQDFTTEINNKNDYQILAVRDSDIIQGSIRGSFRITRLLDLMKNTLSSAYPFVLPASFDQPQDALVNIRVSQKVLNAAFPDWDITNDFTADGLLHSNPESGRIQISAPLLKYKNTILQGLLLDVRPKSNNTPNTLYASRLQFGNYAFDSLAVESSLSPKGLNIHLDALGGESNRDRYDLTILHQASKTKGYLFFIEPSTIQYQGYTWDISRKGSIPSLLRFQPQEKTLYFDDIWAKSNNQLVTFSGYFRDANSYRLNAQIADLNLKAVLPAFKNFAIGGRATLSLDATRAPTINTFKVQTQIASLTFNEVPMGALQMVANGNTQLKTYSTELAIQSDNKETFSAKGTLYQGSEGANVNMDLSFEDFRLDFLNALAQGSLDSIRGQASGKANLWGPLAKLRHDGVLSISKAGLSIPYLNAHYQFADRTSVVLNKQSFLLSKAVFQDRDFETKATLTGQFSHANFKDWALDFDIATDRILVFDIPQSEDRVFYGQGFFGGLGSLSGPAKSLLLKMDGKTETGTNVKVPWTEEYGLVETSYIDFISKTTAKEELPSAMLPRISKKPFEMDFELDVTNAATIEIVIDPETNSSLSGRGVGTLLMEINTDDKFNMWGDFLTTEGVYNFKNLGLIEKKFILEPGGSVSWEGDPLGAQMNMEAVYVVPGGANPALLLDNPNFNRKIPTEVAIQLQGNLLQPDDPKFRINFPNTNNVVVSEINYRLADPQRSQLQAISLLSQGVFISDVSVSVQGITNNLYEKASDVLSSMLGESDEKLKVGVNYLQGDRNNELAIETEDRLGLTLSTQISDKILINGKIGVPVGGIVQTQVVGDVQIDFILNEDGTLRAKVFNKENEFRYIGEDFGYTQGMGLSYDVDFNTFRELIQKIKKKAAKDTVKDTAPSQQDIVQFQSKN